MAKLVVFTVALTTSYKAFPAIKSLPFLVSKKWEAVQLRAAGALSSCGMSAKVSPQILLRLRPRIVGLNEGRGCGAFCPLRCFAALPRNLAPLWGWMEVLAVAAFLELFFIPYAG